MLSVYIHPQFHTAPLMPAEMKIEVEGPKNLGDLIRDICAGDHQLLFKIIDERGEIRSHVAIFVGNEHCKYIGGLDAEVKPFDEVSIYPALSGG